MTPTTDRAEVTTDASAGLAADSSGNAYRRPLPRAAVGDAERQAKMGTTARQVIALAIIVLIVMVAAGVGGLFTGRSVSTWYRTLSRPDWTPPNWLFGPVWTVLYLAMAVAAWMVWRKGTPGTTPALAAFAVQLALNVAWSGLFFGLRSPAAGMVDIVLLWLAIAATIALFLRVSIPAGLIMTPYLAWVTFAAALNFAIWRMN